MQYFKYDYTPTILIVDDEPLNIQVLGLTLKQQGYESEFATNGEEALEWGSRRRFDLILLDIMMPGIDGYEVCRQLKNDSLNRDTQIIFLTGKYDSDSIVKGFEAGAADYITKPFNARELLARIKTHLELSRSKLILRQKNREVTESERRFRQLFEHTDSGIIIYEATDDGSDFRPRDCNRPAEKIEGIQRRELLNHKAGDLLPWANSSGLLKILHKVRQTGQPARKCLHYQDEQGGRNWRQYNVYKLPSGEIVTVFDDISAQKQAEEEKKIMEDKLRRAQKMEAIGLLASGVAHDLNNILAGVVAYPEMLLMQLPADSNLRKYVEEINSSGLRAAAVVEDLLAVARSVNNNKKTHNLNTLINEYLLSPEYRKLQTEHADIRCHRELEPVPHNIKCNSTHIKKCLMNLVINAAEAIVGNGEIFITTTNQHLDTRAAQKLALPTGEYVVLQVRDTGSGISNEDLEHIFEPFYTKKVMGRSGTGLGLAVVWNTIRDHEGAITVTSNSEGTHFKLYFPVSKEKTNAVAKNNGRATLRGNGEKILVVDDETQLLKIAKQALRSFGYEVALANSGEEALDYLRENRVDLVLLDMIMDPGLNGYETYKQIIKIHPGQKAVIVSGFSDYEGIKKVRQLGVKGFIKKPYTLAQMGKTVLEELRK